MMARVSLEPERLGNAIFLLQPTRPVLVTSLNSDGSVNVAPFSWFMPVSMNPPLMGLALLSKPQRQRTLENIEREGEFVVSLPGIDMVEQLVRASFKYESAEQKWAAVGLAEAPSTVVRTPGLAGCRAHIECRPVDLVPTGDHTLVVSRVEAATYDGDLYDENLLLRLDRVQPLLHLRQRRMAEGQRHFFLRSLDIESIDVKYDLGALPEPSDTR